MNLNISLKHLTIFYKIVSNGSIVDAAQELHLTPSAISRSLQTLEEHLGTQLINRTTRNLATTQAGNELYLSLHTILSDLAFTMDNIMHSNDEPRGIINISCPIAFGTTQLVKAFVKYREKFPLVHLNVHLNDQLENLNEGKYDLALRIVKTPPDNYAIKKLTEINWLYCASPRYLHKYGRPSNINELYKYHNLVNSSIKSLIFDNNKINKKLLENSITIEANSGAVLLQAALLDQGIAYLPTYMLGNHINTGDLIPLFEQSPLHVKHHLYALYLPNKFVNQKIRTFIDFIYDWLNPIPPWGK